MYVLENVLLCPKIEILGQGKYMILTLFGIAVNLNATKK